MSTWLKRVLLCASFVGGLLALAAGPASADEPPEPDTLIEQTQEASNTNTTDQSADSSATTTQVNVNAPIAILSADSNNGDVNQSNDADTTAVSYNSNSTDQSIGQGQTASTGDGSCDPCGGDGSISQDQSGSNSNETSQDADSEATTTQVNVNAPISILSYGSNNGDVNQSNDATTTAYSGNSNETTQGITQDQGATSNDGSGTVDGCGCPDDGDGITQTQDAANSNRTDQDADAKATTEQSNWNVPISVLSFGGGDGCDPCGGSDGNDVTQSNDATTTAYSRNENATTQNIDQTQTATSDGDGCPCPRAFYGDGFCDCDGKRDGDGFCGCDGKGKGHGDGIDQTQEAHNSNQTKQDADATAKTEQKNWNSPVSILSFGGHACDPCDGSGDNVHQSNEATTTAYSGNDNSTTQGIGQSQAATSSGDSCCPVADQRDGWWECCEAERDGGISQTQRASNDNATEQKARSYAKTRQKNWNGPISILSFGSGGGDVTQVNDATTTAWSSNGNATWQGIEQDQVASEGGGA